MKFVSICSLLPLPSQTALELSSTAKLFKPLFQKKIRKLSGLHLAQAQGVAMIRSQAELSEEIPKNEKNEKEFGLVVSQADPDSESGRTQTPRKREKRKKSEKGKKRKRIWPNGPQIRNLQVELSLSPNFDAERTLIPPFLVTSKFHIC